MKRQEADHARYMRNREVRKAKQREYYALHRDQCRAAVQRSRERAKCK